MIAKRADSKYNYGRSRLWLKVKSHKYDDFLIVGCLHSDSRQHFKGLVLADNKPEYRGHVDGGFGDRALRQIYTMMSATVLEDKPIGKHERFDSPVTWVRP